jgi:hypothetical protein
VVTPSIRDLVDLRANEEPGFVYVMHIKPFFYAFLPLGIGFGILRMDCIRLMIDPECDISFSNFDWIYLLFAEVMPKGNCSP